MQNKEGDNNNESSARDSDNNHAELQDINLKRSHSGAFAIDDMSSNSYPSDLASPSLAKPEQPSPPVSDGSTPAKSQEFKAKSQIIAHKFIKGISKAPETLSLDDVYLKQPSLISWDTKHPNPTSIADLVLQEAEICETLKKHPHPNIVRYFGCLGEDDKIVGLVLGKYTSKLSDKVADSTPDQRVKLYEGVERGVRHLHQIGLIHNDLNPANIMLDGNIPVIIDFDSCRLRGEKMGDKRVTFGRELEEAELAAPENDLHGLEKLKEYIVSGGKVTFD
ncbi:uncharacterized protein FTJAE_5032 [Fusarium tjaetaba]|uniref:Autophagy-related protein 1 n=1 Tax=Fusarium tjaetaba TaxID=1567544 RepID=A0A8H5RVL0_9HYPO|nr:uncharacterized protein FTJAE_5032 [Fusarium tjaetaba]KAF5638961.1 hypothetical protein FTJAE_5032 [Fusarium tjaetaba]